MTLTKKATLLFAPFMLLIMACASHPPLETVDQVDLQKYTGTWYEIARLPTSFEEGLKCVTASYSLKENGKIRVVNKGHKTEEPSEVEVAEGTAKVADKKTQSKLKVTFFWPFYGDYWILALDNEYRYAMVGDPSRDYLWILSRTKELDPQTYERLLSEAEAKGFNTEKLIRTEQDCQ